MTSEQRQNRITAGFIILSLLLHLLLILVPKQILLPASKQPEPVYVEVRPAQPRERELDLPIRKELEKPRKKPARRLAEKDQIVEKETAPEGRDTEDRTRTVRAPEVRPDPVQPVKPTTKAAPKKTEEIKPLPVTREGWQQQKTEPKPSLPDLQTLTQISPDTLARIESDWRQKYRADIERGDTVWMDTEQDLLISFMRRFRDNIYGVWNYPADAARREQQGTSLVRVTIDRQGNIIDVVLLESSGYRDLDEETIRAIQEGATYGPLPRAYPNEDLKIMAFFQYRLTGAKRAYRRRPGSIY
jgi:protein TonB